MPTRTVADPRTLFFIVSFLRIYATYRCGGDTSCFLFVMVHISYLQAGAQLCWSVLRERACIEGIARSLGLCFVYLMALFGHISDGGIVLVESLFARIQLRLLIPKITCLILVQYMW